jgi:hypothetical protein
VQELASACEAVAYQFPTQFWHFAESVLNSEQLVHFYRFSAVTLDISGPSCALTTRETFTQLVK